MCRFQETGIHEPCVLHTQTHLNFSYNEWLVNPQLCLVVSSHPFLYNFIVRQVCPFQHLKWNHVGYSFVICMNHWQVVTDNAMRHFVPDQQCKFLNATPRNIAMGYWVMLCWPLQHHHGILLMPSQPCNVKWRMSSQHQDVIHQCHCNIATWCCACRCNISKRYFSWQHSTIPCMTSQWARHLSLGFEKWYHYRVLAHRWYEGQRRHDEEKTREIGDLFLQEGRSELTWDEALTWHNQTWKFAGSARPQHFAKFVFTTATSEWTCDRRCVRQRMTSCYRAHEILCEHKLDVAHACIRCCSGFLHP